MTAKGQRRAGRRIGRRPVLLFALGVLFSLAAGSALAAVIAARDIPRRPDRPLVVKVFPASRTVSPGAGADYKIRVSRFAHRPIGLSGRTTLALRGADLPRGVHAAITAAPTNGAHLTSRRSATLTITTATDTPPGTYRIWIRAARPARRGSVAVGLTVSAAVDPVRPTAPSAAPPSTAAQSAPPSAAAPPAPAPPATPVFAPEAFTIAGVFPGPLIPGIGMPLDLVLTNREDADLRIASLSVEIASVRSPRPGDGDGCSPTDFSVRQFSGAPGFELPASTSADLAELGVAPSERPRISMLNLPVDQDGCEGASLTLSFSGVATEPGR